MKIENAKQNPKIFYGLHMEPGVAEYRDPEKDPYRILISEETIKNMDATFAGRPVYVKHVDAVDLSNLQNEADGYVVESFFNKVDGKHWVKFIVVSDKGHEALSKGWKLSNAYIPKEMSSGGLWHGVEYQKEVMKGEYEHLAIVPNPRYENSIVLTPEQFKSYNEEKALELQKVANSKGETSMFEFLKRSKVENAAAVELEQTSVLLPKSKKEMTIAQLVTDMDAIHNMHGYANGDHMVKCGDDEMSVNDMLKKYEEMKNKMDEAEKAKAEPEKKENEEEKKEEPKKENEEEKKEEAKKNAAFEALKNAPNTPIKDKVKFELLQDKVARGQSRYGSK